MPSIKKAFQSLLQEAREFQKTFVLVGNVPWREVYEYPSAFGRMIGIYSSHF